MKKKHDFKYQKDKPGDIKLILIILATLAVAIFYIVNYLENLSDLPLALLLIAIPIYFVSKLSVRKENERKHRENAVTTRGGFAIDEEISTGDDDVTFAKIGVNELPLMRKVANNPNDEIWAKLNAERMSRMSMGYSEIFVAKKNGEIVGEITAHCANKKLPEEAAFGRRVYFEGFRVLPEYRRQHIGTRLMQYVINEFKSRGYYEFTIGVEADNLPALTLYKKLGFTEKIAHGQGDEFDPCEYDLYIRRD